MHIQKIVRLKRANASAGVGAPGFRDGRKIAGIGECATREPLADHPAPCEMSPLRDNGRPPMSRLTEPDMRTHPRLHTVLLAVVHVFVAGCGGGGDTTEPPPPAVSVSISPSVVTLGAGATQQFTATVSNSSNVAVNWSASGGSLDGTGATVTYTAPAAGGTYTVTARSAADPSKAATSTATVTPVAVAVAPVSQTVVRGEPVTMTATVSGTPVTGVTWSAGCGGVTGTGSTVTWTAPLAGGPCMVTARSALDPSASASATMTVRPSFRVATLGDADDGTCSWTHCSLREAINAANAQPGADSIGVVVPAAAGAAVANVLVLSSALPAITSAVHIVGPGADMLGIDANATVSDQRRIFEFNGSFAASVSGLTLTGGVAAGGGAVSVNGGADVSLTGVTMTDNETRSGDGGALRVIGGSTARLTNVIVEGNRAVGANVPGAGISVANGGAIIMTGGRIKDNVVSDGWGGGVRVLGASLTLTNVMVQDNRVASGAAGGGGIFAEQAGTVSLDNATVSGNSAPAGEGGGVRIVNGAAGTIRNSTIAGNSAASGAGLVLGSTGAFTVTGTTVDGNTSATRAGGVWLWGTADVTFTNTTISDNVAQMTGGGGLYLQNTAIARLTNSTLSGNSALGNPQNGGAVWAGAGTTVNMTGGTIENNTVDVGWGPGVYSVGSSTSFSGVTFRNNSGNIVVGGGVAAIDNSSLTITGGSFINNVATGGSGGAIFLRGSTASIQNASFNGNQAGMQGGGLQLILANTVTVGNTTFTGNQAAGLGGAIGVFGTTNLTVSNSVFTGNSTGTGGGAIAKAENAQVTIADSRFLQNTAVLQSGAFHATGTGAASVNRSTFTGNTAVTGGGAITNGGPLVIENSTFSANTSGTMSNPGSGLGGALFFASTGNSTLRNSTVSGNTATTYGGGVAATGVATIQSSTIVNNSAATFGGGIVSNNNGTMSITSSMLVGNLGGGMAMDCGAGPMALIISLGYNLAENFTCSLADIADPRIASPFFNHPTDKINTPSGLNLALADNGGPTHTHSLLTGSAAINSGNPSTCAAADQRGYGRVGTCDIGAFEFGGAAPAGRPSARAPVPAAVPRLAAPAYRTVVGGVSRKPDMKRNGAVEVPAVLR